MKLAIILIIGTLVSQQTTEARKHRKLDSEIFDARRILKLIRSGEKNVSAAFTQPPNLLQEIPESFIENLVMSQKRVNEAIQTEANKSIINLENLRNDGDGMVQAFFATKQATLTDLINCLIDSSVDAKAFYDAVQETAKACINVQYEKARQFVEDFWLKFTEWASLALLNQPTTYQTCKVHQKDVWDVIGAFRKLDCMVKAQTAYNANAAGFFTYARTALKDFLKLSRDIPKDVFKCVKAAAKSINDFNKEMVKECKE